MGNNVKKDPASNLSADPALMHKCGADRHSEKGRVWGGAGEELSKELFDIARKGGTETPFTGKYWDTHEKGMYKCAICGNELFSSETKFDSGTGWPSFTDPVNLQNIELKQDTSHGMARTEVLCKKCGAHLGHVFDDGPAEKGGKRYCINSVCLDLEQEK